MERGDSYEKLVVLIHETTHDQILRIVASIATGVITSNPTKYLEGFKTMIVVTPMTTN
jgi:hypothetical protein